MVKVRCIRTCWMPQEANGVILEKYEDIRNEDVFEIEDDRLDEFLSSSNFEKVK